MPSLSPHTQTLGKRLASHLLRRSTFKIFREKIDLFAELTPDEAVEELFLVDPLLRTEPSDPLTGEPWIIDNDTDPQSGEFRLRRYVLAWWINEAVEDDSIYHRLQLFWHTVFPTDRLIDSYYLFDHLALLQFYAFDGNFKTLARKMVMDNNMLTYLDNNLNFKNSPNENFAREYLELHTIQRGDEEEPGNFANYTEEDVTTAARLLTGYRFASARDVIDPDTGIPMGFYDHFHHDTEDKQFSEKFQNRVITGAPNADDMARELEEFVDMIFDQRPTAENIIRRLYQFFVNNNITTAIETDIIQPLTDDLIADNFNIIPSLKQLLKSQHFYDQDDANDTDHTIGSLLRSPLDMFIHIMNTFYIFPSEPVDQDSMMEHYEDFYFQHIFYSLTVAGMDFFFPPTVAGYTSYHQEPGYSRNWFNSATLIGRFQMPDMFLESKYINPSGTLTGNTNAPFNIAEYIRDSGFISDPSDGEVLVREFLEYTLPELPDDDRISYFQSVFLDELSLINWQFEWENYIENGDASSVELALKKLFRAVLYSEEFQLM